MASSVKQANILLKRPILTLKNLKLKTVYFGTIHSTLPLTSCNQRKRVRPIINIFRTEASLTASLSLSELNADEILRIDAKQK